MSRYNSECWGTNLGGHQIQDVWEKLRDPKNVMKKIREVGNYFRESEKNPVDIQNVRQKNLNSQKMSRKYSEL